MSPKSPKEVKVYTTDTCPFCTMAKSFLADNNIAFTELNVAEDKAARDEMIRKSGRLVVPVIEVDGEIFVGFNRTELKKKLEISQESAPIESSK
jgi:glutaredoxin-like YruB-family protein